MVYRNNLENQIADLKENFKQMESNYGKLKELVLVADEERAYRSQLENTIEDLNEKIELLRHHKKETEKASVDKFSQFCEVLEAQITSLENNLNEMQASYNKANEKLVRIVKVALNDE